MMTQTDSKLNWDGKTGIYGIVLYNMDTYVITDFSSIKSPTKSLIIQTKHYSIRKKKKNKKKIAFWI